MLNKLIYLLLTVLLLSCDNSYDITKKYCKIDSIIVYEGFKVTPEPIFVYCTNCDIKISSKKQFNKNDSLEIKLIKFK